VAQSKAKMEVNEEEKKKRVVVETMISHQKIENLNRKMKYRYFTK